MTYTSTSLPSITEVMYGLVKEGNISTGNQDKPK